MVIDDCDDAAVIQTYAHILKDLNAMNMTHVNRNGNKKTTATTTRVSHVLIGNAQEAIEHKRYSIAGLWFSNGATLT